MHVNRRIAPTVSAVVLSLLSLLASARTTGAWDDRIQGALSGNGTSVALDADGNVIAGGNLASVPMAIGAFGVVKLSGIAGDEIWRYTFGTAPAGGQAEAVAVTSSGDVVAAGETSPDGGLTKFAVFKLNGSDGSLLWRVEIAGEGVMNSSALANSVGVDGNGDVVASGWAFSSAGKQDIFVVKLSGADGSELWRRSIDGTAHDNDVAAKLALDANGDVVVAGSTMNTATNADFTVVKLAGIDGSVLWDQRIDDASHRYDRASDVALDPSGNAYATGYVESASSPSDIEVVKLDASDGSIVWEKALDGGATGMDEGNAIALDANGFVLVTGDDTSFLGGSFFYLDMFVVKLQGNDGAEVWRRIIDGGTGTNDVGYDITSDAAGDVIVAGSMMRFDTYDDFAVVKLDGGSGTELWRRTLKGQSPTDYYEKAVAVTTDASGHPIAVGRVGTSPEVSYQMEVLAVREEISGTSLRLATSTSNPLRSKLMVVSNDSGVSLTGPNGPSDLVIPANGGATLQIFNPTTSEVANIALPAAYWRALPPTPGSTTTPRAYLYNDPRGDAGPCRKAMLVEGFFKAVCKGDLGFSLDEPAQGSLAINLIAGNGVLLHCMQFGGTVDRDTPEADPRPGMFKAQGADAPAACAVP